MEFSKLFEFYIVLFFKHNYKDISLLNKKDYDLEYIYKYCYAFWKDNFNIELDLSKEEDKNKLFDFLNDIFRYKILNDCLEELYLEITDNQKDSFLTNNLSIITSLIKEVLKKNDYYTYNETDLPKLSKEELDDLFIEFLLLIDESKEMLNLYENIKTKNIIFIDELDEEKKKKYKESLDIKDYNYNNFVFKNKDNKLFITIERKGNISDLRTLVHEFIHYYIYYYNSGKKAYYLLEEFPSMFYEYIANKFLYGKGYSIEDINKLYSYRFKEINDKSTYLSAINYYLELYSECGFNVTHEIDVEKIKEKISNYIEENGIDKFKEKLEKEEFINDPDVIANDYCDVANFCLIMDPYELVKNYPYLIGQYLTLYYIDELVNNRVNLKDMKELTKNLPNIYPNIILEINEGKNKRKELK